MIPTSLLVIDDDPDFNTLVKFILQHDTDWKIWTALDGKKGISLAKSEQPSLILLDLVMPKINGIDTYSLLNSNLTTSKIPVIFITAMGRMEKIIKDQITEDIEVIIKPFDMMTLSCQIIDVCDRYLSTND